MDSIQIERVGLDKLDAAHNPFQSNFWAKVKRPSGWRSFAFAYTGEDLDGNMLTSVVLVLVRRLFFGLRLAYIPFGPPVHAYKADVATQLKQFSRSIRPLLPRGTAFIRFDLPWFEKDRMDVPHVTGRNIRICSESVQPEGTARIDLTEGIEAVRSRYRERARRNIRKAKAHDIVIRQWDGNQKTLDAWFAVYVETAKRDGFSIRGESYFNHLLRLEDPDVASLLYLAYQGDKIIGGSLIISSQAVSVYLFGASLRVDGCSPSYLLQDAAIRDACERGCAVYDLHGISGPHARGKHLEGLRLFKRAFGGYVCYRQPSLDYVYRRLIRFFYVRMEAIRYSMHRRRHPKRMSQQFSVSTEE